MNIKLLLAILALLRDLMEEFKGQALTLDDATVSDIVARYSKSHPVVAQAFDGVTVATEGIADSFFSFVRWFLENRETWGQLLDFFEQLLSSNQ